MTLNPGIGLVNGTGHMTWEPEGRHPTWRTEVMGFGKLQTGRGSTGSDVMMNRKCMEMGRSCDLGWETVDRWGKGDCGLRKNTRSEMKNVF